MGTIDTELIWKWIKQQIMFDQATITYRKLAQESSCGVDQARELLEKFCDSQDAKNLKVHPTYLIFGQDKHPIGDCIRASRIERATACELEEFKSKFHSVSCVQIYSISATQAPDPNLLKSCTKEPIILKSKTSVESCREEESQKESETKQQSKIGQIKAKAKTGGQEPIKKTSNEQPKTKTTQKSDVKPTKKNSSIELNKNKAESKKSTIAKSDKKVLKDEQVSEEKPDQPQTTENDKHKEEVKKPIDKNSNDSEEATSKKKRNSEEEKKQESLINAATTDTTEERSSKKRVRKTRIVKKKKIIRVKDKKGYRVNREEIEEVEESYSEWESSENELPKDSKNNKKKKVEKPQKKQKDPDPTPTISKKEETPKPVKDKPVKDLPSSRLPPTKKKNSAPVSKEQSNITSFFKKG